jgi:hypothetical protein
VSSVIRHHSDPCHYEANGIRSFANDLLSFEERKKFLFTNFSALTQPALQTSKLALWLVRIIVKKKGK